MLHVKHMHRSNACFFLSSHLFLHPLSIQGKRLPAYLSADAEEGEVSDDDSADEIEDDFKLKSSNVRQSTAHKHAEMLNRHVVPTCFILRPVVPIYGVSLFFVVIKELKQGLERSFKFIKFNISYYHSKTIMYTDKLTSGSGRPFPFKLVQNSNMPTCSTRH